MKSVAFHPDAESEFLEAVRYYSQQADGLGSDFLSAVRTAIERVAEFPDSGRPFGERLRRVIVRGFPYAVIYRAEGDDLVVIAVAHLRRRPGYWRLRD
ncbi:MAG: type II toxin-antitoxin system RelE/ParE family toxin [Candidatus Binatia bacterium]|nr:type II toxin-antitoxin system RelE/ParE family toxin [Candidatus Binatia bacterium]